MHVIVFLLRNLKACLLVLLFDCTQRRVNMILESNFVDPLKTIKNKSFLKLKIINVKDNSEKMFKIRHSLDFECLLIRESYKQYKKQHH